MIRVDDNTHTHTQMHMGIHTYIHRNTDTQTWIQGRQINKHKPTNINKTHNRHTDETQNIDITIKTKTDR